VFLDIGEAVDALCTAKRHINCIQRTDNATDSCAIHKGGGNLRCGASHNVNPNNTNTRVREEDKDGANVVKSLREAIKMMEQAKSTTQKWDRSWPGMREDDNATKMKGTLTYVLSYSTLHSSTVGMSGEEGKGELSGGTSLRKAVCVEAVAPGVPYFWMIILRLARVHFNKASSEDVHDESRWSKLAHALTCLADRDHYGHHDRVGNVHHGNHCQLR
jgi:hypothetical protein